MPSEGNNSVESVTEDEKEIKMEYDEAFDINAFAADLLKIDGFVESIIDKR